MDVTKQEVGSGRKGIRVKLQNKTKQIKSPLNTIQNQESRDYKAKVRKQSNKSLFLLSLFTNAPGLVLSVL